ncbi:hypothetical protein D9M68_100470 [compost metagenome]
MNYHLMADDNRMTALKPNSLYQAFVQVDSEKTRERQCPDSLSFDAEMPEHYHGMPTRAEVTRLPGPDCRFQITGILFQMSGDWRLHFDLRKGRILTRASSDVKVKP